MNFIDEIVITVYGGDGGNGCLGFYRLKQSYKKKPCGGNGGNGGNVFLVSNNNLKNLFKFTKKNIFKADKGKNGKTNKCNGKNGNDLYINVPINTKIFNLNTLEVIDKLVENDKSILIAKGGLKGLGNINFKDHLNKFSKKYYLGKEGECIKLKLELELSPNIGVLGFANVGKSSITNLLSNSNSLIKEYPFTTKNPKLGTIFLENFKNYSIMDTPAIVKGSYLGKCFGLNFLKHLKNCNLLFYIIDICLINKKKIIKNIKTISKEINIYNSIFNKKNIWIVFNKIDLIKDFYNFKKKIINNFKLIDFKYKYYFVSSITRLGINNLFKDLSIFLNLLDNIQVIDKSIFIKENKFNWN